MGTLRLLLLAVVSLAPAFAILSPFTRIVIVLSFVRNVLATQQIPPNQVIIGLALFDFLSCHGAYTNQRGGAYSLPGGEIAFEAVEAGGHP